MARNANVSAEEAQQLEPLASEVCKIAFGEQGFPVWGTKFSQIEAKVTALGVELARQAIQSALSDQSLTPPSEAFDTELGRASPICTEAASVTAQAGTVDWNQPKGYLKDARRSFFPSGPSFGS